MIYELAHHEGTTATALSSELGMDTGQLSRILAGLKKTGLIDKQPSETDGRKSVLRLAEKGDERVCLTDHFSSP